MSDKPFDLKSALRGEKVITRVGIPVSNIYRVSGSIFSYPVIACVIEEKWEIRYIHGRKYNDDMLSSDDLIMAPKIRHGWINIYPSDHCDDSCYVANASDVHASKEIADASSIQNRRVACIRIEWEE